MVEEIYDDNIFLEAVDEEIDFITHYRPDIHARLNFKDHIVEFGAMGDIADFSTNEKENYTNHAYDAGLFLNFARLSLGLKGYFADTTDPSSSATLSELGPRIRHWDSESVGVLGIQLGKKAKMEFDARFYGTRRIRDHFLGPSCGRRGSSRQGSQSTLRGVLRRRRRAVPRSTGRAGRRCGRIG